MKTWAPYLLSPTLAVAFLCAGCCCSASNIIAQDSSPLNPGESIRVDITHYGTGSQVHKVNADGCITISGVAILVAGLEPSAAATKIRETLVPKYFSDLTVHVSRVQRTALGAIVSAAPARSEIRAALQSAVPQNWVVAESTGFLIISNKNEVTFYNAIQTNGTERDRQARVRLGKTGYFVIKVTIGPFLSQDLYDDIWRTLPKNVGLASSIPFQAYYSERHDALPNGYGPGYSVYVATDLHPYYSVWPESAEQECVLVLESVQRVFDGYQYPGTNVVQHDGPANGSQPVLSETNRTSSAASSRR